MIFACLAEATIKALESGDEDVFPDPMAKGLYGTFREDPKVIERDMLHMAREAKKAA